MKKILLALVILMFASNSFAADLAVTITKRQNEGASRVTYGYITADETAYTTGGLSVTARMLGLDNINSLTFGSISSSIYSYLYDYTNSTVLIYETNLAPNEPVAVSAAADKFNVIDDNSASSNGKLLVISATNKGDPYFGYMDSTGVASAATSAYPHIAADDSVTIISAVDSTNGLFYMRAVLIHADTIFFDDNGTQYNRLLYSGTGLGNMGDLYIPFGDGNLIKIRQKSNSQITQALGVPLYFDEDAHIANKILCTTTANADSYFGADITYGHLPYYNPLVGSELTNGTSISVVVRFMAVGN